MALGKKNAKMLAPTWIHFSPGPFLRRERDKWIYHGLFYSGEPCIGGLKKMAILLLFSRNRATGNKGESREFTGLGRYFEEMLDEHEDVQNLFRHMIRSKALLRLASEDFSNSIAVHIRLGDYSLSARTPLEWYAAVMQKVQQVNPSAQFRIFSDGTDEELALVLKFPNTRRCFMGNALADMVAISRCQLLLGSDSTFSGRGAYLGQIPCIWAAKHFGRVLVDSWKEIVMSRPEEIPPASITL